MRVRSTGLGKAEMIAAVEGVRRQGDYLIMEVKSSEPTIWHIRVALNYSDIAKCGKLLVKPSILSFLLFGAGTRKNPKLPGEY